MLYLVAHSTVRAGALFMVGRADRTHDRARATLTRLGGFAAPMPITFRRLAAGGGLSMGGLPLFFGFLAKEEIYSGLRHGVRLADASGHLRYPAYALMFAVAFAIVGA